MHTDIIYKQHIHEMEEILRRAYNNKRQYFIEPFLKMCAANTIMFDARFCPVRSFYRV